MLRADQPSIVDDLNRDTRVSEFTHELVTPLGVRSWLMIPLRQRGKAVGALTVVSRESEVFGQSDVSTMAPTGAMISALIESHRELSLAWEMYKINLLERSRIESSNDRHINWKTALCVVAQRFRAYPAATDLKSPVGPTFR